MSRLGYLLTLLPLLVNGFSSHVLTTRRSLSSLHPLEKNPSSNQHQHNSATSRQIRLKSTLSSAESTTTVDEKDEGIGAWIPICSLSSLKGLGPQRVTVMGVDLVVFEGEDDDWSVLADLCPHRLAPLSQGRVDPETNCIECPYHGWQFDTSGALTALPQLETDRSVESVRGGHATSFPVHQAGDLLYAFLPSSIHGDCFPQSMLPEDMFSQLREEMGRNITYFTRVLPYSFDFVVENFLDPGHVPYAHAGLQSVRSDGIPIPMETSIFNFTHIELTFKDKSRGKDRDGFMAFQRPSMYHFRLLQPDGNYRTALSIHIVPVRAGFTRVMLPTPPVSRKFPRWLLHAGSNRFLNTDVWLHDAEIAARSRSLKNLNYVYASESDNGVKEFRRWWVKQGLSKAPPNTFGPSAQEDLKPLTRAEQIDPWEYHGKQCSSCRKALKRMKRVQSGGLIASVLCAVFLRRWPVPAIAAASVGFYVSNKAKQSATVIEGNPYASGTADRSVAHQEKGVNAFQRWTRSILRRDKKT